MMDEKAKISPFAAFSRLWVGRCLPKMASVVLVGGKYGKRLVERLVSGNVGKSLWISNYILILFMVEYGYYVLLAAQ